MSKINSVRELILDFGIFSLIKRVRKFFLTCLDSCQNSKANFFFQVINFCLIVLFFWFIFPRKLESLVISESFSGGIFGNFVLWVISTIFFPVSKIFETSTKITITIFLIIVAIVTFCYAKLLIKAFLVSKSYINKNLI